MKLPAFQFYPADWRKDPAVQSLSYHDRGVWFEILCLMHESDQRGKLLLGGQAMPETALSRLLGLDKQNLTTTITTLLTYGVASRDEDTGALMSRRMVRDEERRQGCREAGHQGGNPSLKGGYNKPGFVYAIQRESDGAVKIGIAMNVENRFRKIRYSDKSDVFTLMGTMASPSMGTDEGKFHTKFSKYQILGEWFKLPPEEIEKLLTLMGNLRGVDMGEARASSSSSSSSSDNKKKKKEWDPNPEQLRLNSWFSRRDSTPWNEKELKSYSEIPHTTPEEWDLLEVYTLNCKYARKDLGTLLNNWTKDLDRARKWNSDEGELPLGQPRQKPSMTL